MEQGISIVFPHALNAENNRVLLLKLKMIEENTKGPYEILMLGNTMRSDLVYSGWNLLIAQAKYEHILWDNTDLLPGPGYDEPVAELMKQYDWLSFRVAECGAIGVASSMTEKDFGRTAKTFRRQEFEDWVKEQIATHHRSDPGFVWYCPSILKKSKFLELGGFMTQPPFPNPNDINFRLRAEKAGWNFGISNHSWFAHLQRGHIHQGLQQERAISPGLVSNEEIIQMRAWDDCVRWIKEGKDLSEHVKIMKHHILMD